MVRLISRTVDRRCGMHEEQETPEVREYEALATVRDILLLLYCEISENTGRGCERLKEAFEFLDKMTKKMWEEF